MKYVQFYYNDNPNKICSGYMEGEDVVDINKTDANLPSDTLNILKGGCICGVKHLREANPAVEKISDITLVAPITGMDKVICTISNYPDCCKKDDQASPAQPNFFSKFASCIIGPNEPLKLRTGVAKEVDYDLSLAFVINSECTNVEAKDAYDMIFGFTIAQDITSKDWMQNNGGQFLLGKAQDSFCPIGPWIVSPEEVADPHNLSMKCSVNDDEKINSSTSMMIHKIPHIIERLSSVMTLLPGDIVLTGSPLKSPCSPCDFLKPGDVIVSEIDSIGELKLTVEEQ